MKITKQNSFTCNFATTHIFSTTGCLRTSFAVSYILCVASRVTRTLHINRINIGMEKQYGEVGQDIRKFLPTSDCDFEEIVLMVCTGWCLNLYEGRSWCLRGRSGHETQARG